VTTTQALYAEDDVTDPGEHVRSPLWLVTQEPALNALVTLLAETRERVDRRPSETHELTFSRADVEAARAGFARMIRRGESRLHRLCALMTQSLFDGAAEIESVVVASVGATGERFVLHQPITQKELEATTDLDLGNRQLSKLRWFDGAAFSTPQLVANVVEYQAIEANPLGVFRLVSRIKAEEEIWNKVTDEIFELDRLVRRDKQLREMSRFVKDVFGLKLVVADARGVQRVQKWLAELAFDDALLSANGVPPSEEARRVRLLEVKDHLAAVDRKASGWTAVKSVVRWWNETFEVQVQPLKAYARERERSTRESHAGFKSRREELRDRIAAELPLFGFYRELLAWLFRNPDASPPVFPGLSVRLVD